MAADDARTGVLDPHSPLRRLADDCEACALMTEQERDRLAAERALSTGRTGRAPRSGTSFYAAAEAARRDGAPTGHLPVRGARAAGRTGAPGTTASGPDAGSRHHLGRGALRALIATAVIAAMAVGVFLLAGGPQLMSGVTAQDVSRALSQNDAFMAGSAADDFVGHSDYRLADVSMAGQSDLPGGIRRVQANAVLENGFFRSSYVLTMDFKRQRDARDESGYTGGTGVKSGFAWVGRIASQQVSTRALRGPTRDSEASDQPLSTDFDEAGQSASLSRTSETDLWFGTSTTEEVRSWTFDGTRWRRAPTDEKHQVSWSADLNGEYSPAAGGRLEEVRISDVDVQAGTFTLSYRISADALGSGAAEGSAECSIRAEKVSSSSGSAQADGWSYSFAGTGTSDGGDRTARVTGTLGKDFSIEVSVDAGYTKKPLLFGSPTNERVQAQTTATKQR